MAFGYGTAAPACDKHAVASMLDESTSSKSCDSDISDNFEKMTLKADAAVDVVKCAENLACHALCHGCLSVVLLRVGHRRELRFFPYETEPVYARQFSGRCVADARSLKRMEVRLNSVFSRSRYLNLATLHPLYDLLQCSGVLNGIEIDPESFKRKMSAAPLQKAKMFVATTTCTPFVLNAIELAAYLDEFLHLPKKMSFMAKSMYA